MKLFKLSLILCLATGCSQVKTVQNDDHMAKDQTIVENGETKDSVYTVRSEVDMLLNCSDPKAMYQEGNAVVIATIKSIDGVNNYSEVDRSYVNPYTYGMMEIQSVYKGNLKVGDEVKFYRSGGTLPFTQFFEGLRKPQQEKMLTLFQGVEKPEYVEYKYVNDVELEEGKTYLLYLMDEKAYYANENEYFIYGFEGGTREIDMNVGLADEPSQIRVFNNYTDEWENIEQIIPQ